MANEGIKRMLAEKAEREADQEYDRRVRERMDQKAAERDERIMASIDAAAHRLDAADSPTKFRPSAALKIAYFVCATSGGEGAEYRAAAMVRDRLMAIKESQPKGDG